MVPPSLSGVRQSWWSLSFLRYTRYLRERRNCLHGEGGIMARKTDAATRRLRTDLLNLVCAIVKRELSRPPYEPAPSASVRCPRCNNSRTIRRGRDETGKQRYQCKTCERSFTVATGSALSSTNIPLGTWLAFAECYVDKQSLRDSATQCSVCLKTAFYMRKRMDVIIGNYAAKVRHRLQTMQNDL